MTVDAETTYRRRKDVDESSKIYKLKQNDLTGKFIIFTLTGLCTMLFLFIIIGFFFISKPLEASLTSVAVRDLRYNKDTSSSSSSLPFFNATLAMEIRIKNPNFGFFEFPTSKGVILYSDHVVGEMRINGQRVSSHDAIRTEVRTEVGYKENQTSSVLLKDDVKRGLIILKIEAKLRGEVHLKALNNATVRLNCLMHLSLKDKVIHRWWC